MKTRLRNSSGLTLVEILISLGIIGVSTMALLTVMQMHYNTGSRADTRSSLLDLELRTYFIQENVEEWLAKTLDSSQATYYDSTIANCLNISSSNCPSPLDSSQISALAATELNTYVSIGKTISTVALKDLEGQPLAGTLSTPLYYNSGGQPVTSVDQAFLAASGFMIRDNASGNPGKIIFFVRLETLQKNGTVTSKPKWLRINLGQRWQMISSDIYGACNAGEYVYGINPSTRSITCKSLESRCATNQYAYGIDNTGRVMCLNLPPNATPQPYTPPPTFTCDSWGKSTASCTIPGGRTIVGLNVANRLSRASCNIGSDVTFVGSTITVRNGCRATFNVYYQ